ncbi:type II secretion system F family protein [Phenylobacterium sp. LjRoot219]|uniref:type II secretion system F family protein n=1 Tax=Phenylobacterium sp. LjRoot219 TaxID=3342283 RepID=UPI003ED019FC
MDLLIMVGGGALCLLLLAASLGMIVLSDSPFAARLSRHRRIVEVAPRSDRRARVEKALQRIGAVAGRGSLDGAERASLRTKLVRAGFYAERAAEAFFAIRVVTAVALGLLAILALLVMRPPSPLISLLLVLTATGAGLYLPNLLLQQRIKERTFALKIGLPDAVDLMVVCLEAGGTLSSGMQRVQSEFLDLHPVISEHFSVALAEMQAGSSRADALTRLAERAGSDEVTGLMTMLVQSEALGASVAQTLRVFAEQTRQARYLEAEKKAAELPVKLSIPLVLFIFPALMTVIFTPLIIRIMRVLLTT